MVQVSNETRGALERLLACAIPLAVCVAGLAKGRDAGRHRVAALLGVLWCLPALLLLQRCNAWMHWWVLPDSGGMTILMMPVELWIGWAVLWGAVPASLPRRLPVSTVLLLLALLDALMMPQMTATVKLHRNWLQGEVLALVLVLLPALVLQRSTITRRHLTVRAALQVVAAAGVFLYLPAEMAFVAHRFSWSAVMVWTSLQRGLLLQCGFLMALPGLSAVQEFAARGRGTPLPYDPPQRLVTSGMYRFVANPIQLSCVLVMVVWSVLLRSPWMLFPPAVAVAYSAGIARWDEDVDLRERFGEAWVVYRKRTRAWLPRWRPVVMEEAVVYIARACSACSAVRDFLEGRSPVKLCFADAETLEAGSITRMRYVCGDETVEGIHALARALEHIHFGWAMAGALLRLPVLRQVLQLVLDASGFGPMELCNTAVESSYGKAGRARATQQ